jgi:hypothetical protein
MTTNTPHIVRLSEMRADGVTYGPQRPIAIPLFARSFPQAVAIVHREMARLTGRNNPSHSSQGGRYTVADPNGANRWDCFVLTIEPARLDTMRVHGPAPAIPATDDPTVRGASYDTPAAYYRVVASEALRLWRADDTLFEREAIELAFGLTRAGDTPGINVALEASADEIAVVRAILHAIS